MRARVLLLLLCLSAALPAPALADGRPCPPGREAAVIGCPPARYQVVTLPDSLLTWAPILVDTATGDSWMLTPAADPSQPGAKLWLWRELERAAGPPAVAAPASQGRR